MSNSRHFHLPGYTTMSILRETAHGSVPGKWKPSDEIWVVSHGLGKHEPEVCG